MKLKIVNEVPKNFYEINVTQVHDLLGGPTLIHLKGESDETIFISTLLHGNETTSFLALQEFLKQFKDSTPPRSIIAFIGNTIGAKSGQRHLPDQPDYNRIWSEGSTKEHLLAIEVFSYAKKFNLFANIDIHNNTGKNPYYACINTIQDQYLHLASLFSKQIVFFTEPSSVQSLAFTSLCPSVTLEAGMPGIREGIEHVIQFLNKVIRIPKLESNFDQSKIDVFHTVARILIDKECSVDFTGKNFKIDISFISNLDELNFTDVKAHSVLGKIKTPTKIKVIDNQDRIVTENYLSIKNGSLVITRSFIPAMFSKDLYVIKEDCLGYIMERMFG